MIPAPSLFALPSRPSARYGLVSVDRGSWRGMLRQKGGATRKNVCLHYKARALDHVFSSDSSWHAIHGVLVSQRYCCAMAIKVGRRDARSAGPPRFCSAHRIPVMAASLSPQSVPSGSPWTGWLDPTSWPDTISCAIDVRLDGGQDCRAQTLVACASISNVFCAFFVGSAIRDSACATALHTYHCAPRMPMTSAYDSSAHRVYCMCMHTSPSVMAKPGVVVHAHSFLFCSSWAIPW